METPQVVVLPDTYPLTVSVHDTEMQFHLQIVMLTYLETRRKRILCTVPFPKGYPDNDFFRIVSQTRYENPPRIATLNLVYDTDKNSLEILVFYVYSAFSNIKPHVTKEEQVQLKGLGIFMLCNVLRYLLSETTWLSPETKVTLTASGDQCYDIETYKNYTLEDCLDIIKQYPYALWFILATYLHDQHDELDKLIKKEIANGRIKSNVMIHTLYKTHPEILYTFITKHIEKIPDMIVHLRTLVCNIMTNQRLIEHHYKRIYHFIVEENLGTEAKMSGTVANILSACDERKIYGIKKSKKTKKSKKEKNKKK
jgi:hypothetical protein